MRVGEEGVSFSALLEGENFRARVKDLEASEFYIDRVDGGLYIGPETDTHHVTIQLTNDAVERLYKRLKIEVEAQNGGVTVD